MADQKSRGGKKQDNNRSPTGKKHQGVRQGSTAREKERTQAAPRKKLVDG
jgi:hypothetical protein